MGSTRQAQALGFILSVPFRKHRRSKVKSTYGIYEDRPIRLMQDVGLSAFDVHSTAEVFAGSSQAITNTRYRSQRLSFRSLVAEHDEPLSQYNISTGLVTAPVKLNPSPYIPRASSFVFHPTEMLCGVGESDGSNELIRLSFLCLFVESLSSLNCWL
ncbi:hypothetical protein EV361DRAFT_955823 [Lentinula raphanica]|uniref:Uncharacterized protein n=1 Tax=Lentinula raphanica TaxID=153919 RepID=A0AA38UAQ4_9AGAR|nr:hypothetical protein F5880DRAFT_1618465 [Lentinula raphanica]KAJ3832082.1 hypothetical protein F5878DRAFT_666898 [Lentinula raphanica]KAJ3964572.1 hypothetical protein EV361DRAFT_955823 [Lentinula raphanica]